MLSINSSEPSSYFAYHKLWRSKILRCKHAMCLCVLYESQIKQQLLYCTPLVDWFFTTELESVYCAVRSEPLSIILVSLGLSRGKSHVSELHVKRKICNSSFLFDTHVY